jgi:1-acyl-sn-glycerol-3-phosphate acyltransferase
VGDHPVANDSVPNSSVADHAVANGLVANGSMANGSMANGSMANGAVPNGSVAGRSKVNRAARGRTAEVESARAEGPSDAEPEREPDAWDQRVASALGFLRRRVTGDYDVDEFGFDPDLTRSVLHPLLRLFYRHYFRVEVVGIDRLPTDTGALLVANHSGTLPLDALMLSLAVHDETPAHHDLRLLGADLVFKLPVLCEIARKTGATLACAADAERLLSAGEWVGVFPEGFKGIGKPYRDRYRLQRFGRGGFVSAALHTGAPIVPVSIVGAEEIYPIVANLTPLARITGLPYVPITPLFPWLGPLGLVPLPSKWLIEFGEPIDSRPYADEADDPIVVFDLADQVRESIQQTLHTLLERRPDPFG